MSHGRHNVSSEVAHLVAEIRRLSPEAIFETHGITIESDKTVYDTAYERIFKNVNEWAKFVVQQDMDEWDEDEDTINEWDDE